MMADDDYDDLWENIFCLATSTLFGGVLHLIQRHQLKIIQKVEGAPTVDVGPALKELVEKTADKVLPYVAIKGQIKELGPQVIQSLSGLKGVLQSITLEEHSIRRIGSGYNWGTSIREIGHTFNKVPFGLKGPSGIFVEVAEPLSAKQIKLFSSVRSDYVPTTDTGLVDGIVGIVTGTKSIGIHTTEKLLPVDTTVTALGKLVKLANNKFVIMPSAEGPYVLTTSMKEYMEHLNEGRVVIRFFSWVFFGVGLVFTGTTLWKLWKRFDKKRRRDLADRQRRENEARLRAVRAAQGQAPAAPGGAADPNANNANNAALTCVVCLHNPREVILMPCGHLVCCLTCEAQLNNTCPVCRAPYTATHVAFLS